MPVGRNLSLELDGSVLIVSTMICVQLVSRMTSMINNTHFYVLTNLKEMGGFICLYYTVVLLTDPYSLPSHVVSSIILPAFSPSLSSLRFRAFTPPLPPPTYPFLSNSHPSLFPTSLPPFLLSFVRSFVSLFVH